MRSTCSCVSKCTNTKSSSRCATILICWSIYSWQCTVWCSPPSSSCLVFSRWLSWSPTLSSSLIVPWLTILSILKIYLRHKILEKWHALKLFVCSYVQWVSLISQSDNGIILKLIHLKITLISEIFGEFMQDMCILKLHEWYIV